MRALSLSTLLIAGLGLSPVFTSSAAAQWLPNGNDIYFTGGHVGVGGAPSGIASLWVRSLDDSYALDVSNLSTGGSVYAINATVPGTSGAAIRAMASSANGSAHGVESIVSGHGSAIRAKHLGGSRNAGGAAISAQHAAPSGTAIYGESSSLSSGFGVHGLSYSWDGVKGESWGIDGHGVHGEAFGDRGTAVWATAWGDNGIAVEAIGSAIGVQASCNVDDGFAAVFGRASTKKQYGVYSEGNFGGTGNKYFVQPHPDDPGVNLRFVCLEGNESGTYFRGSARLVNGTAEIAIPEEWQLVTEAEGITVQVTPRMPALLAVPVKSRERIQVVGTPDVEFDYFVNGVRRGFADFEARTPNREFRPTLRGVPFGEQYPDALREILVQNGILNADFTPNETTAARMGWKLVDASEIPVGRRAHPSAR